jgi:drug/metabolite transporter (DMT)-like permease
MPTILLLILVLFGALMSAIGGVFLKLGAVQSGSIQSLLDLWRLFWNWRVILGLSMYFVPALLWIYLLRKVELSLLQPLFAIVYVITPVLAMLVFKEHVSLARWLGIGVIMVGVIIVARS